MPHPDTIRQVLIVISFVSLFGMVKRPFYGVMSYLIIMMVRPGLFNPTLGAMRIELIVGLMVIIVMILSPGRLQKLLKLPSDPIGKKMLLLFGVMLISMVQAFDFKTSWEWMNEFIKVFLFFLMIVTLIDTERDIYIFLGMFLILTGMMAYDAIYNFKHGIVIQSIGGERVDYAVTGGGMGAGHVALANMIMQGMPLLWYMMIANKKKMLKLLGIPLLALFLYGVVISGSRGGFVGLIAFGICLVAFTKRRIMMLCAVLAVMFIIPVFSARGYMDYMSTVLDIGAVEDTGSARITGLRNGFEMMVKRPILGVGPGCYPVARKAWFGWGLWAHNHYGELMGDLGILGTIIWFGFLKSYFIRAWRFIRKEKTDSALRNLCLAVVVATIVRLVIGMGTHSVYIFFWYMVAGIIVSAFRIKGQDDAQKAQLVLPQ